MLAGQVEDRFAPGVWQMGEPRRAVGGGSAAFVVRYGVRYGCATPLARRYCNAKQSGTPLSC